MAPKSMPANSPPNSKANTNHCLCRLPTNHRGDADDRLTLPGKPAKNVESGNARHEYVSARRVSPARTRESIKMPVAQPVPARVKTDKNPFPLDEEFQEF